MRVRLNAAKSNSLFFQTPKGAVKGAGNASAFRSRLRYLRKHQSAAEEGHHKALKADSHGAGVRARIHLECVRDAVFIESVVELRRVHPEPVLIADVDGDCAILPKVADVLIQERQRSIRRPLS